MQRVQKSGKMEPGYLSFAIVNEGYLKYDEAHPEGNLPNPKNKIKATNG